ncbi:glycerol-3-phosphate dehydrogenase/oxidase [Hyunsoonleella pacifica]|uniref:Glycerol-3-phosphate dehydrogenase n=1 Tax=Hyunsoonleella pacifica TaxID=1080224 RepID=A0A4V2JAV1_9FLAO|nr:glycerol-3-phosphate dehydrogenase/oxidase [Hyunsoonleella pacifica]TBN14648.1 glycerol-3-phosphate dehydrogenase/oxidase [Hyunsoonleella pacifica]GGD15544.1 aerobic glycerol-3-phosphate dehydrogenase [Hyunsoonleella pacifica]
MKASNFSILNREKQIAKLHTETFDLVIIGGGITGAGIALDATARGLKVCLVEKNDFASGTSNKSTKLIHGGLRYLKNFEISLVRESGSERAIVHNLAPHLVSPQKMLLPLIEGGTYGKLMTAIGLRVYDFLADVKSTDRRKMLNKEETLSKEPLLDKQTVIGGGLYAEYRTDDARLTIEILKKATHLGATIVNYCEMTSFNYDTQAKIESVNCKDANTKTLFTIKATNYISAAGPWVDTIRKKDNSITKKRLHLTKGIHLVFPFEKLPVKQSIYFDVSDGRMVFAIPRGRVTYVGTTDTDYSGSLDRVIATKADANYLLQAVNNMFQTVNLTLNDIESNWAGLRPLIHEDDKTASELSRKDEIFISKSGLISMAGGKLTGYRKMAYRALDAVFKTYKLKDDTLKLNQPTTETMPLVNPPLKSEDEVRAYQQSLEKQLLKLGVKDHYYAWYLCSSYGKQADIIIKKSNEFENSDSLERLIRAELWYSVHCELVNGLTDFFVRRTGRLYFDIKSVKYYKNCIVRDMSEYLSWDANRIKTEEEKLNLALKDATTYYNEDFK